MSSYDGPTFGPSLANPLPALLDRLEKILREGVPEYGLASPPWEDARTPAPAGHYFLPQGSRIYRSDWPERAVGNYVIIHPDENLARRSENDPRFWLIPIDLQLLWERATCVDEMELLRQFLEQFLGTGFQGEGEVHHARHYLSSPAVHIFEIRDVVCLPLRQTDGWKTALTVSLTFFCAGKSPA